MTQWKKLRSALALANEMGLTILDASHYGLEHIFMHIMYEYLKGYCMDVEIGIADVGVPFSIL